MAERENTGLLIIGVVVLGLFSLLLSQPSTGPVEENWDASYQEAVEAAGINPDYFEHNPIIDKNEEIVVIANDIKSRANNAKDAVKMTMDYVYDVTRYSRQVSPQVCFAETSSDVLDKGYGDCVSMSKLVLSLLREQGIAARPTGGCISGNFRCGVLFSTHADRMPIYSPVDLEDPKKRGGLHEWVEIWLPDEGWIIGEATSGQLFSKSCESYDTHDYNTDSVGMCVITDYNYIRQCARF